VLVLSAMSVGWLLGAGIGVLGLAVGVQVLRSLARRRVAWWPSVAGPLLTFGPALGLILGTWFATTDLDRVLFWRVGTAWPAMVGWSLVLFFGVTAVFAVIRAFLTSRVVVEDIGLRIPQLMLDAVRLVVWVVMVFVIVGAIWHRTDWFTGLFTLSLGGSALVLLALQDTLKNFISGMAIVTEGMYAIDDWVWIGDDEGQVVSISRRTTKIRTRSGDIVVIPNMLVTSGKVRNQSRPTTVHAEYLFASAPHGAPPNRVREVLREAVLDVPDVLTDPAPVLRVAKHGENAIEYEVKIWLSDLARIPDIKSECRAQIWYHFRREGIKIPYPVRELRRRRVSEPAGEAGPSASPLERLRSVPFFAALPEELLLPLAGGAVAREFGAGERIVRQGDTGDSCYVVDGGRAAVLVTDGTGERQVAVLEPGSLFGEMSLLTGEPRSATVRAQGDVRLLVLSVPALRTALERSPRLAHDLAEAVTLRKEGLLEARARLDAEARAHVLAASRGLVDAIRRFFRLPNDPA
jgi:small-conductance mechanosensitive channel/CRP-like cAMP-binding protein